MTETPLGLNYKLFPSQCTSKCDKELSDITVKIAMERRLLNFLEYDMEQVSPDKERYALVLPPIVHDPSFLDPLDIDAAPVNERLGDAFEMSKFNKVLGKIYMYTRELRGLQSADVPKVFSDSMWNARSACPLLTNLRFVVWKFAMSHPHLEIAFRPTGYS